MLKEEDKRAYTKRLLNPDLSYLAKKSIHAQILAKAKKCTKCRYCGALNGPVKKGPGLMKIVHDNYRGKKPSDPVVSNILDEMLQSTENNRDLAQYIGLSSLVQELNPLQVLDLFKSIPKVRKFFYVKLRRTSKTLIFFRATFHSLGWLLQMPAPLIWLWHAFMCLQFVSVRLLCRKLRQERKLKPNSQSKFN